MFPRKLIALILVTLLVLFAGTNQNVSSGRAQDGSQSPNAPLGTSITYQGTLTNANDNPINGSCNFRFSLYDAAIGGGQVGSTLEKAPVALVKGSFTVELDFGSGVFTGEARWLELAVKCSGDADYATLSPRQPLTATPYASYAVAAWSAISANSAASAPWSGLTGIPAGFADNIDNDTTYTAGTGLILNGTQFSLAASYWGLTGNAGTDPSANYLGTSDNQPLELRVNGQRVLRLEPSATSPNLLGGSNGNTITAGVVGATIAGGGTSGAFNRITGNYGTVGGGANNQAGSDTAIVDYATVGGGGNNIASGMYATVPGGALNTAAGNYSLAAGYKATASATGSFVWADGTGTGLTSYSPNEFLVRAANGAEFYTNAVDGIYVSNSSTTGDGIHLYTDVDGSNNAAVWANNYSGTAPGIYAQSGGTYSGYFTKQIYVSGGCIGCTLIYVAQNKGSEPLEMGDVTAAVGVGEPLTGTETPVIQVRLAGGTDAGVVGVVLGKAAITLGGQDGQVRAGAEAAAGPAAPGDYVFIVVQGLAYVKADATDGAIATGQRLTTSGQAGQARAMQTRTVDGMQVAEAAPVLGIALAPLDEGQGLIPVMVALR